MIKKNFDLHNFELDENSQYLVEIFVLPIGKKKKPVFPFKILEKIV